MDGTLIDLHFDNTLWNQQLPTLFASVHAMGIEDAREHPLRAHARRTAVPRLLLARLLGRLHRDGHRRVTRRTRPSHRLPAGSVPLHGRRARQRPAGRPRDEPRIRRVLAIKDGKVGLRRQPRRGLLLPRLRRSEGRPRLLAGFRRTRTPRSRTYPPDRRQPRGPRRGARARASATCCASRARTRASRTGPASASPRSTTSTRSPRPDGRHPHRPLALGGAVLPHPLPGEGGRGGRPHTPERRAHETGQGSEGGGTRSPSGAASPSTPSGSLTLRTGAATPRRRRCSTKRRGSPWRSARRRRPGADWSAWGLPRRAPAPRRRTDAGFGTCRTPLRYTTSNAETPASAGPLAAGATASGPLSPQAISGGGRECSLMLSPGSPTLPSILRNHSGLTSVWSSQTKYLRQLSRRELWASFGHAVGGIRVTVR